MRLLVHTLCVLLCIAIPMQARVVRFINGRIVANHSITPGELWISDGKIIAPSEKADSTVDVAGLIIAPGLIDLQINGGFGIDFTEEPERVLEVAKKLPQYGVTSFLPTCITSSKEHYRDCLTALRAQMNAAHDGANLLGIHLEGPFFNVKQKGAHNSALVRPCDCVETAEELYGSLEKVMIVTLAPELPGAENIISQLHKEGIIISCGHSSATYDEMQKAMNWGLSFATHLFNAMTPFHHREPGVVGSVLGNRGFMYSVIADPHHLHQKALELAYRLNPEGLVLVSDAMSALGLPAGHYHLGTMQVEVDEGKATISGTNILAGSIIALDSAMRYLVAATGCSLVEAIDAATIKPATLLNIQHQKGTLEVGADADFILLDDTLHVHATYIAGEPVSNA